MTTDDPLVEETEILRLIRLAFRTSSDWEFRVITRELRAEIDALLEQQRRRRQLPVSLNVNTRRHGLHR